MTSNEVCDTSRLLDHICCDVYRSRYVDCTRSLHHTTPESLIMRGTWLQFPSRGAGLKRMVGVMRLTRRSDGWNLRRGGGRLGKAEPKSTYPIEAGSQHRHPHCCGSRSVERRRHRSERQNCRVCFPFIQAALCTTQHPFDPTLSTSRFPSHQR